jgi:hypothetical protein
MGKKHPDSADGLGDLGQFLPGQTIAGDQMAAGLTDSFIKRCNGSMDEAKPTVLVQGLARQSRDLI